MNPYINQLNFKCIHTCTNMCNIFILHELCYSKHYNSCSKQIPEEVGHCILQHIRDQILELAGSWFSMSPLPRLHHHDIMTIVELLHCARTKLFCHILPRTKRDKSHSLSPSLNPNCNTTPWPFSYKALLTTAVHCTTYNTPTLHNVL